MATMKQALEKMREICLSFPDTREGEHFGQPAFFVGRRMFASCENKHGTCEITFGLEPDHAQALVKNDPRFRPYPRDRRGVVLDAADVNRWEELEPLLRESYGLVKAKRAGKAKTKTKKGTLRKK